MPNVRREQVIVNMGPQHPAIFGPLRLELCVEGEIVLKITPHIGYMHRCYEKFAEKLEYTEILPFSDRIDYVSSMNNNLGLVLAVEKLLGIEIPKRGDYIRIIMAELNRIASHLFALGHVAAVLGTSTPLFHSLRDRETILELFRQICGSRLLYNYVWIGGVSNDLTSDFISGTRKLCKYLLKKNKSYQNVLLNNQIFIKRTANIGALSPKAAVSYGVSGPNLRASGIPFDLRRDDPYSLYHLFNFEIPVGTGEKGAVGDCWDRYMVRISEIEQSIHIVERALSDLPSGDFRIPLPKPLCPKIGEIYLRTEAPRGELGYYIISDGSSVPVRCKARTPSFSTLNVLNEIAAGTLISDVAVILASLDIMPSEADR